MSLTLGLTGMDPATETALTAAFVDANKRLNGHWQLLPEAEADHVVVDMDSMYGPMSWLRLHAAGKRVIGLTTAARTQTDFRLGRPFDGHLVAALLRSIAEESGVDLAAPVPMDLGSAGSVVGSAGSPAAAVAAVTSAAPAPAPTAPAPTAPAATAVAPAATAPPPPAPVAPLPPAPPSGPTPAPAPRDQLPEEAVRATNVEAAPAPPAAPLPPRDPAFVDWLAPGVLQGRFRYRREAGPSLLIDATARQYHGPAALKPVAAYFEGVVRNADFEPVDAAAWAAESVAAGTSQPLQRLQWFGGLLACKGTLLPDHDPAGRYKLNKWPQTEREFPKHFRIATAMMKGPATLPEIATASGIPVGDVADFINASLVTGFAELVPEPPPEPLEPAKPTGLLGRLRGR